MQIKCATCRYEYDYAAYGEMCPQCGSENQPFRSAGARRTMGTEVSGAGYFDADERERRARIADPMYGKSPLGRLKPYFIILVFLCGVAFLGKTLVRYAQQGVSIGPSAPSSSLAAALGEEGYVFAPAGGMCLTVGAAATLPDAPAPAGEKWVYVELTLAAQDTAAAQPSVFVPPVLAGGDTVALPEPPDAAWADGQPLFDAAALSPDGQATGRLFYRLPRDLYAVTLFYQQDGNKQQVQLRFE